MGVSSKHVQFAYFRNTELQAPYLKQIAATFYGYLGNCADFMAYMWKFHIHIYTYTITLRSLLHRRRARGGPDSF